MLLDNRLKVPARCFKLFLICIGPDMWIISKEAKLLFKVAEMLINRRILKTPWAVTNEETKFSERS